MQDSVADKRPLCPRCGLPARYVIVSKAHVRCILNDDMTPGKVISYARSPNEIVHYKCGFDHIFEAVQKLEEEDE